MKNETLDQINTFLDLRNDFKLDKFNLINQNIRYSKLVQNNLMLTLPNTILKHNVDGYFAAYLKKIK